MTELEQRNKIVSTVTAWLGAVKGDAAHHAIIDTYNTIKPLPRGVRMSYAMDWCAATVSAAFQASGLIDLIPPECSCGEMMRGAQAMGIWVEDDGYRPRPGDIVMYDWQDNGRGDNRGAPDHVGIVTAVGAEGFTVTEGNMGSPSRVGQRPMLFNGRYIRGFIVPNYAAKASAETPKPWYQDAMDWAKTKGIMDGTRPMDGLTRAEAAIMLQRLYNLLVSKLGTGKE